MLLIIIINYYKKIYKKGVLSFATYALVFKAGVFKVRTVLFERCRHMED
jgi:hypothetical protein